MEAAERGRLPVQKEQPVHPMAVKAAKQRLQAPATPAAAEVEEADVLHLLLDLKHILPMAAEAAPVVPLPIPLQVPCTLLQAAKVVVAAGVLTADQIQDTEAAVSLAEEAVALYKEVLEAVMELAVLIPTKGQMVVVLLPATAAGVRAAVEAVAVWTTSIPPAATQVQVVRAVMVTLRL